MKSVESFALNFYAPILVSAFLILIIVVSPKFVAVSPDIMLRAEVSVPGVKVPLPFWLDPIWLLRGLLIAAAIVSLVRSLALDFSKYFPTRLHMDVYFDLNGIKRSLSRFSPTELAEVSINPNWEQHIAVYDKEATSSLGTLWNRRPQRDVPNIEDFCRDLVHARGSTTFLVKRVSSCCYRITESSGRLDYDWDIPPLELFDSVFSSRANEPLTKRPRFFKGYRAV